MIAAITINEVGESIDNRYENQTTRQESNALISGATTLMLCTSHRYFHSAFTEVIIATPR